MSANRIHRGLRQRLTRLLGIDSGYRSRVPPRSSAQLQLEELENRIVPYTFPIVNLTGLSAGYNIYVLGYSTGSQLELQPNGQFAPMDTVLSGTTTANSSLITGLSSTSNLFTGEAVTGAGIPANATISQIVSSSEIMISPAASATGTGFLAFADVRTGTTTDNSQSITGLQSTTNLVVGQPVFGPGIQTGTTISQINSSSAITISVPATAGGSVSLTFPTLSGNIPSYNINTLTSLSFDPNTMPNGLNGARIYFFAVPTNWPATANGSQTNPPAFPFANHGVAVTQALSPPNTPFTNGYPPFVFVEPTVDPLSAGGDLHIDVQTVDGFSFPLTLTAEDSTGASLGQVGQPSPTSVITRGDILSTFANIFPPGSPYRDLIYSPNSLNGQAGGVLNPGAYLNSGANPDSLLNTIWDTALTTLFTGATVISMQGDDGVTYTATSMNVNGLNVLLFTGGGNTFAIYNPDTPDPSNPNPTFSAGGMVFANNGVFSDTSGNVILVGNRSAGGGR